MRIYTFIISRFSQNCKQKIQFFDLTAKGRFRVNKGCFKSLPTYFLPLLTVGLSAGFINGLLGAGGGIILVLLLPRISKKHALSDTYGMENRDWYATALSVMLPATVISGTIYFLRGGVTDLQTAWWLMIPAAAGGFAGALLLGRIDGTLLKRLFAALVIFSGIRMIF